MRAAIVVLFALLAVAANAANVKELTPDNFDNFVGGDQPALVEFFAPWCGHCKKLAPTFEELATNFIKEPVIIASVDADQHKSLGSQFSVQGFPTIKYFPANSKEPEEYNGGREIADFTDFLNRKAGTKVRVKLPPSDTVVLTDDTFDGIVLDPKKNVLVEFYAPWCGHCKKLAPEYEKLGQTFMGEEEVVIAKYDADKHKGKGGKYGVTGFPTLLWFPKDKKSDPVKYTGGRTLEDLTKYVNQNSGTSRLPGGGFEASAGTIEELAKLAKDFIASADKREQILGEAKTLAESLKSHANSAFAKFYTITMEQIIKKGENYVADEVARLERLIAGKAIKADKLPEMYKRKNVVSQFKN